MADPFGADDLRTSAPSTPTRRPPGVVIAALIAAVIVIALVAQTCGGPSDTAAELVTKGLAAQRAQDNDKARKLYEKAADKDPRNKYAHYNLGLIAQTVDNDLLTAEREYNLTLAIDQGFAPALFNLGILRANAGRKAEAVELYRDAITADDAFGAAHFNLGLLLRDIDPESEEATAEINRGIELDPELAKRLPTTTTTPAE